MPARFPLLLVVCLTTASVTAASPVGRPPRAAAVPLARLHGPAMPFPCGFFPIHSILKSAPPSMLPAPASLAQTPSPPPTPEEETLAGLRQVRRIYVDRLSGGDTAAQIRDMIISSLQATKLFVITESPERADAALRGSAEDLVFTDTFSSSESLNARASLSAGPASSSSSSGRSRTSASMGVGENESTRIAERKHEASAAVRLVGKDGDVLWSFTAESQGAKFRGASADVADKIARKLAEDYARARGAGAAKPRSQ